MEDDDARCQRLSSRATVAIVAAGVVALTLLLGGRHEQPSPSSSSSISSRSGGSGGGSGSSSGSGGDSVSASPADGPALHALSRAHLHNRRRHAHALDDGSELQDHLLHAGQRHVPAAVSTASNYNEEESKIIRKAAEDPTSMFDMSTP